jgi:hypothetical protein
MLNIGHGSLVSYGYRTHSRKITRPTGVRVHYEVRRVSNGPRVRTKIKCLGEGLFLTVNSNTINEEDRLTSPSLLMTSLRGLKVP